MSDFLDKLGTFLSTDFGVVALLTTVSLLMLNIVGQRLTEQRIARENNAIQQKLNLTKLKEAKTESDILLAKKAETLETQKEYVKSLQDLKINLEKKKAAGSITAEEEARLATIDNEIAAEQVKLDNAQEEYDLELAKNKSLSDQVGLQKLQTDNALSLTGALSGVVAILGTIVGLYKLMAAGIGLVITLTDKEKRAKMKAAIADKIKAAWGMASSASAIPVAGWIIAAGILLTILGISISTAIANNVAYGKSSEKAADDVNKLSNEIYKLTERANAIKTVGDQFDALDKKIIKTTEDQKKLNELLDSAGDKLSDEKKKDDKGKDIDGTSEKDIYAAIETDQEKYIYLQNVENEARKKANDLRQKQLDILKNLNPALRHEMLTNKDNAEYLKVQSAVRAINNNTLYEYIDSLKDAGNETEAFAQAILNELDAEQQYQYAIESDQHSIKNLVDTIDNATTIINGEKIRWTDLLGSDDYTFKERINAFKELEKAVKSLNDPELLKAFQDAYQE